MTSSEAPPFHALVTGATGGIGRATCLAVLHEAQARGQSVRLSVAASRPGAALDELVGTLRSQGAEVRGLHGDLADPEACQRLAGQAVEHGEGRLDLLVSNAGMGRPGPLKALALDQWELLFQVNVRATWLLAQASHAALANARGSVVAIASMAGLHPHPGSGAYSTSKAALLMLCRQMAQEWAADGIRVNTISPGMVRTPLTEATYRHEEVAARRKAMVPLGRIGTGDDIARAVAYLGGPGAGYVTGSNLLVDGGFCDHLLATLPGLPPKPAEGN
ncbi:SDR family oxidoreductase [Hydrogenophaga sp.]|uniref:SDR family NAD(P)-dependent oxidoreductase n=1 Tax=Hydrogenophaga sp. TaxID=1904254 RepID=UPI00262706D9|nr:SDR family oxidoreductase [Hydrogenophaga sp.]MCW5654872.1 SDR family oxidoreductase [Hydrogenophaga sp.]